MSQRNSEGKIKTAHAEVMVKICNTKINFFFFFLTEPRISNQTNISNFRPQKSNTVRNQNKPDQTRTNVNGDT